MKKTIILFAVLFFTKHTIGQDSLVFKNLGLDTSSALMGVCQFYDNDKVYKKYCFYIDKKEILKEIASTFSHGDKIKIDTADDDVNVYIIKDKEILPIQIGISPKYKYINIENDNFWFNPKQLETIANAHHLSYTTKSIKFKNEEDFNAFVKKSKSDPNFLCFEDITEELEGMFSVDMKIENKDKPASYGWDMIENDLKKIGAQKDKDYIMSYTPKFDKPNIYHYDIRISKQVYDKLNSISYTKGKWTMNVKEIIAYWRK